MSDAARYRSVMIACGIFLVLTIVAMLLYPGGRIGDVNSSGYAFYTNFFSDLGQTQTHSGTENLASLVLFCLALAMVAYGMCVFFVTFTRAFAGAPGWTHALAAIGAAAACASGVCFLGVAATPWNLFLQAHNLFTSLSFEFFLAAVVCDLVATLGAARIPRVFSAVFCAYALLLAAYIALLVAGPRLTTPEGAAIQAVGQKIIVYASVLTIFLQSLLARRFVTV